MRRKERKRLHMLELKRRRVIRKRLYEEQDAAAAAKKAEIEETKRRQLERQQKQLALSSVPEKKMKRTKKSPPIVEVKEPEPEVVVPLYFTRMRSKGWYDVIDADGNVMNKAAMRLSVAEAKIKKYEELTDGANS